MNRPTSRSVRALPGPAASRTRHRSQSDDVLAQSSIAPAQVCCWPRGGADCSNGNRDPDRQQPGQRRGHLPGAGPAPAGPAGARLRREHRVTLRAGPPDPVHRPPGDRAAPAGQRHREPDHRRQRAQHRGQPRAARRRAIGGRDRLLGRRVTALLWARSDGGMHKTRRVVTLGSPFHGADIASAAEAFVPGGCSRCPDRPATSVTSLTAPTAHNSPTMVSST